MSAVARARDSWEKAPTCTRCGGWPDTNTSNPRARNSAASASARLRSLNAPTCTRHRPLDVVEAWLAPDVVEAGDDAAAPDDVDAAGGVGDADDVAADDVAAADGVDAADVVDAPDVVGAADDLDAADDVDAGDGVDAAVVERDVVEAVDVVDEGAGEKDSDGGGVGGRSIMAADGAGPVTAWMAY